MKMTDLRSMSPEDLQKKEIEFKNELGKLSFQHKIRPLENTARLNELRKDIARIHSLFNEN
ncbi:MAG: 50S ribosomal protein L29 [Proteobacteria bacterium]|nr:50S ribosomal protein L29 [Pseudomonadota bacterium]